MFIKDLDFLDPLEKIPENSININGGAGFVRYSSSIYASGNARASSNGIVTISSGDAKVTASYSNTADRNTAQAYSGISATGGNTLTFTQANTRATPKFRLGFLLGLGFALKNTK